MAFFASRVKSNCRKSVSPRRVSRKSATYVAEVEAMGTDMNELRPGQSEFTAVAKSDESVSGNPDRFVNREFSWLQFNRRVL